MRLAHLDQQAKYAPNVTEGGYTDAMNDRARRSVVFATVGHMVDDHRTDPDSDLVSDVRRRAARLTAGDYFLLLEVASECLALAERHQRAALNV